MSRLTRATIVSRFKAGEDYRALAWALVLQWWDGEPPPRSTAKSAADALRFVEDALRRALRAQDRRGKRGGR